MQLNESELYFLLCIKLQSQPLSIVFRKTRSKLIVEGLIEKKDVAHKDDYMVKDFVITEKGVDIIPALNYGEDVKKNFKLTSDGEQLLIESQGDKYSGDKLVCEPCGNAFGRIKDGDCVTWHSCVCSQCLKTASVTELRDFRR